MKSEKSVKVYPVLFRSMMLGNSERKYAQVHIISNMTVSRLWKLNKALYGNKWKVFG